MSTAFELTDIDRRIWQEELDGFVPSQVFDAHSHIYRWAFNLDPEKESSRMAALVLPHYAEADWEMLDAADATLMPGREVHRLSFPFPFSKPCNFDASNEFIAGEVSIDSQSGALMLVQPDMDQTEINTALDKFGFLGFKPYRVYASSGDAVNCPIVDFMPEHQIEIAHERGLIIMMHLSKPDAIGDADNLKDLQYLCRRYPNVRWILAHCARSYSTWAIEKAAPVLKELPNVWYDTSSVCETDAIAALLKIAGTERVMYGSDDIPIGVLRGKYITFGYAWAYLSPDNHAVNLDHCNSEMTFTRYEQLRAMKRAADLLNLSTDQINAMFYDSATSLIAGVQQGLSIC